MQSDINWWLSPNLPNCGDYDRAESDFIKVVWFYFNEDTITLKLVWT